MRIIIDTLGADLGVEEVVLGVLDAKKDVDIDFTLVGPIEEITNVLRRENVDINSFEYIDTAEYISNDDDPVRSIRRKKNSSVVLGLNKLNEDGYDGIISAGSTGALLAGALFITKRIENVDRACITAIIPSGKKKTILVDTGAVMDSKPEMLRQFAIMASIYSNKFLGVEKPEVYLLNVGSEANKGDKRSKDTFKLLRDCESVNFMGNIEARDLLSGKADVIVADGFAGNVALKSAEGTAKLLLSEIKKGIYSSLTNKLAGLILKGVFKDIGSRYDYKEVGSAILLGVKKPVFKAHGSSDRRAIYSAIINAKKTIENDVIQFIEEEFEDD